jgi:hypothetical protein
MVTEIEQSDNLSSAYLELGCQYYAIARYSASVFFMPICGTIFHHAIEMLIKGYLVRSYSSRNLKKVGHNLSKLWSMFKSNAGSKELSRYDKAMIDLDRVEMLRYPDAMVKEGFTLNVRLGIPAPAQFPGDQKQPQYFVNVSDLDEITLAILAACKVNPKLGFKNTPAEFVRSLPPSLKPWE